jgi:DNA gyrase inhibitor GyrI
MAGLVTVIAVLGIFQQARAFEAVFEKTPVDNFEIKTLPSVRVLETRKSGSYFDHSGDLFKRLFSYIREHDIDMTTPVQAEFEPSAMRFFLGSDDADRELSAAKEVRVRELPARTVASYGERGGYSQENVMEARVRLEDWLSRQAGYERSGEAYGVFWSAPFVPWFLKRFEIHIPVRRLPE